MDELRPVPPNAPAGHRTHPEDAPLPGCSLATVVGRFFTRYARFSGRASRSEYWWITLILVVITIAAQLIAERGNGDSIPTRVALGVLLELIALGAIVVMIMCAQRGRREGARFDRPATRGSGGVFTPLPGPWHR